MASKPYHFSSKVIVVATLHAKPEQADALQGYLADLRKIAESNAKPGCLTYRTSKAGDIFNVYEEYVDKSAFAAHLNHERFKTLWPSILETLSRERVVDFYEEFGSE